MIPVPLKLSSTLNKGLLFYNPMRFKSHSSGIPGAAFIGGSRTFAFEPLGTVTPIPHSDDTTIVETADGAGHLLVLNHTDKYTSHLLALAQNTRFTLAFTFRLVTSATTTYTLLSQYDQTFDTGRFYDLRAFYNVDQYSIGLVLYDGLGNDKSTFISNNYQADTDYTMFIVRNNGGFKIGIESDVPSATLSPYTNTRTYNITQTNIGALHPFSNRGAVQFRDMFMWNRELSTAEMNEFLSYEARLSV